MLLRDRGDADAAAHLREGTKRWFVTARDETKEMAWWQIATTKATRRADVAEAHARTLESTVHELRVAVERERENRARVESVLRDAFDEPVVRDALRAFPEDADTPHADDGSVVAARVFRALERRVAGDADARWRAARTRETYLAEAPRRRDGQAGRVRGGAQGARGAQGTRHAAACRHRAAARSAGAPGVQRRGRARVARGQTAAALRAEQSSPSGRADETRGAIQSRAVADAVAQALRTRHDEAHAENLRLREALRVARTERGEADWEHARARESAEAERVAAVRRHRKRRRARRAAARADARDAARGQRARARRRGGGTRG